MNTSKRQHKTASASQNCAEYTREECETLANMVKGQESKQAVQDLDREKLTVAEHEMGKGKAELPPYEPFWDDPNYGQQAQHSPLPWRTFSRYVLANGRFLATAHAIGDTGSASKGFSNGQEPMQSMNEAEANAKLIVASVNHAELKEAFKNALHDRESARAHAGKLAEALRETLPTISAASESGIAAYNKAREALAAWSKANE